MQIIKMPISATRNPVNKLFLAILLVPLMLGACASTAPAPQPAPAPVQIAKPQPVPKPVVKPAIAPEIKIPVRPTEQRAEEALIRAAGNHAVLMAEIAKAASEDISSAEQLNGMMQALSQAYSPKLGASFISYGALIGAQNPDFVEGVLNAARAEGLDTIVYGLYASPDYALSLPNADIALAEIKSAWRKDIGLISGAGNRIKQQSYSLQENPGWKKMRADSRKERIGVIGRAIAMRFNPPLSIAHALAEIGTIRKSDPMADSKRARFWQIFGRHPQSSANFTANSYNFTANSYTGDMSKRALSLAALEILGATGRDSTQWIENYMQTPALGQCLKTAELNTRQCLAAAHFKYEDAFCMAEHQLKEISSCLSANAN